jgi:hypothetical protein
MAVNGTELPSGTTEDNFLALLVAAPRPVQMVFKSRI